MVRTERPDAVHKLRVAARRLRSITAAVRPVLDRAATDPLRAELKWLGQELSDARDAEVALAHLRDVVAAERVGRPAVQHRAGGGRDAAQPAGGDPELVDRVGPFGPQHHVRRLQRGELRPDGIEHDVPRRGPVLPRRRRG